MSLLPAGVLLPEDILNATWFQVFAGFVALNTIIYMGLTLSKMVTWPRQARMRDLAARLPGGPSGNGQTPGPAPRGETPPDLRTTLIRRDVPVGMAFLGGLLIVLNVFLFALNPGDDPTPHMIGVLLAVVLLVAAQVLSRVRGGVAAMSWSWAVAILAIAAYLTTPASQDHEILALALLMVMVSAFGYVLVSWRPFIVTGVLMLVIITADAFAAGRSEPLGWVVAGMVALAIGALLVQTRLVAINALDEARRLSQRLATTDPLTGLLSHAGMESILPRFIGTAQRSGDSICVMYVEVPDLPRAIADYGSDYGDAVLVATGDAVREAVRDGDLVSRWRTNAFLVAGFGLEPDQGMLRKRIQSQLDASGVHLGKWPIAVQAGATAAPAADCDVDQLIRGAEAISGQQA